MIRHFATLAFGLMLLTKAAGGVWVLVQSQVVGWGTCEGCGMNGRTVVMTTSSGPVFVTETPDEVAAKWKEAQ